MRDSQSFIKEENKRKKEKENFLMISSLSFAFIRNEDSGAFMFMCELATR